MESRLLILGLKSRRMANSYPVFGNYEAFKSIAKAFMSQPLLDSERAIQRRPVR
jgi:hypothetical protein